MENLGNCVKLDKRYKTIGIGYNMTIQQREEYKKLVNVAKERELNDKDNFLYRVRGPPENLRIIRKPKI